MCPGIAISLYKDLGKCRWRMFSSIITNLSKILTNLATFMLRKLDPRNYRDLLHKNTENPDKPEVLTITNLVLGIDLE